MVSLLARENVMLRMHCSSLRRIALAMICLWVLDIIIRVQETVYCHLKDSRTPDAEMFDVTLAYEEPGLPRTKAYRGHVETSLKFTLIMYSCTGEKPVRPSGMLRQMIQVGQLRFLNIANKEPYFLILIIPN